MSCIGESSTERPEPVPPALFAEILERARLRDEKALVTLYRRALPVVYRYVMARLGRPDLVEDIVSEVFLTMVESIGILRAEHEPGFYAWLIQIAQGKIARTLRHLTRKERNNLPLPDVSDWTRHIASTDPIATDLVSNPVSMQEWRETLEELSEALGKLSIDQQTVVIGRFLAGQSIDELASAMGKQPGAVRALQFRALGVLADHLGLTRRRRRGDKGELL